MEKRISTSGDGLFRGVIYGGCFRVPFGGIVLLKRCTIHTVHLSSHFVSTDKKVFDYFNFCRMALLDAFTEIVVPLV